MPNVGCQRGQHRVPCIVCPRDQVLPPIRYVVAVAARETLHHFIKINDEITGLGSVTGIGCLATTRRPNDQRHPARRAWYPFGVSLPKARRLGRRLGAVAGNAQRLQIVVVVGTAPVQGLYVIYLKLIR